MAQNSIKKNAAFNVLKTMMNLVFPVITFPYVSRVLLPDGIGKVSFANSIVSYYGIIAALGIGTYGIREASKVRQDRILLTKCVKEIFLINLISTVCAYILFAVSLYAVPSFKLYRLLLCICSLTIILTTIGVDWLYSAMEDFQYIALRSVFFQILTLGLIFLFVKEKSDYVKYAGITVISACGNNILNFFHARKYIDFKLKVNLELRKHIKPVLILFATSIAASVFTILDTSMLGLLTNTTEVGYYSAAVKIVRMVRDLFPAVFGVLFARISLYVANDDNTKIIQLSEKTLSFIICFALPVIMGLMILMTPVITLLCGIVFLPAVDTARILLPLIILSACTGFLGGQVLISYRRDKVYLLSMIFAAVANTVLNFIFIPRLGAFGAAFATVCSELVIFLIDIWFLRDLLSQLHITKNILQCFFSTLVMSGVVFVIYHMLDKNVIASLIVSTISGILSYGLVLLICKNEFMMFIINNLKMNRFFNRTNK